MPEKKARKKRVRTAPFPLPPEKLAQVQAARLQKGEELPATFTEDERHFVLQIGQQTVPLGYRGPRPMIDWAWHASTFSIAEALGIIDRQISQREFSITAEYRGEPIGKGKYLKRGYRGLEVETIETSGAMVGLLETALAQAQQQHEEEQRREEEAQRTVPCDYPGCGDPVLVSEGPARQVEIQVGGNIQTLTFYGCEGMHREALQHASSLSITLITQAPGHTGQLPSRPQIIELETQETPGS